MEEKKYVLNKIKISDFLKYGQENAVPLVHLVKLTGDDARTVRRKIFNERLSGIPILADNATGYFLPANEYEITRCVRSMKHRAREIERAADAIGSAELSQIRKAALQTQSNFVNQTKLEGV